MNKILIRHLSGDRAQQADEFAVLGFRELIVGRDPAAQVRFDPDRDDLVSRQHLKIVADPNIPNAFLVMDLQSRNGTFLNRQRVFGSQRVSSGDVIQLGPGGPEIRFELDPPPAPSARPTRVILPLPHGMSLELNAPRPVGRATVERMLGDVFTRVGGESRKGLWIGVAALVAILAVGGGTWFIMRQNASDTAAAQRESQLGLKQVNEELAKNPALVKSMRDEIARLQEQLKRAQEKTDRALQKLSKSIQPQASARGPELPALPPPAPADEEFTRLTAEATQFIDQNKTAEAMEVARKMMRMDASRFEGYALGGISAYMGNQFEQAVSLLQQAAAKAPPERRQQYEELAKQCRQAQSTAAQ